MYFLFKMSLKKLLNSKLTKYVKKPISRTSNLLSSIGGGVKYLKKPLVGVSSLGATSLSVYGLLTGSSLLTGYGFIGLGVISGVAAGYSCYKNFISKNREVDFDTQKNYHLLGVLGKSMVSVGFGMAAYSLLSTGFSYFPVVGVITAGAGLYLGSRSSRNPYADIKKIYNFINRIYKKTSENFPIYSRKKALIKKEF